MGNFVKVRASVEIEVGVLLLVVFVDWLVGPGISRTSAGNSGWKVTAACPWKQADSWRGGSRFPSWFGTTHHSLCVSATLVSSSQHQRPPCSSSELLRSRLSWRASPLRSKRHASVPSAASSERCGVGWSRSDGSCSPPGLTAAAGRGPTWRTGKMWPEF